MKHKKSIDLVIKREAAIREYLSKHLDKIDDGLTLVKKEYKIKGFGVLDILARNDYQGYYGIIEIKRDKVTPSKLRDQILRYIAAVRYKYRLDEDNVYCFLIGTDFNERIRVIAGHLKMFF